MRGKSCSIVLALVVSICGFAQQRPERRDPKPGFNLFSVEDDIRLGAEAKVEIAKQMQVVDDREINAFVRSIGDKLMAQPQAGKYPYSFTVVNQKSINAFALPGGPMFLHTGLLLAADNEAQIAGVMAHEIAHVALRHGTNQVTKANLIQLPAMLAGGLAGTSMLGRLAQLGIGVGANSMLLRYSRSAENDADLVGTRIMAGAGYSPVELARFFEKLEAGEGRGGAVAQFFSDHPNSANRKRAIEDEVRYLPQKKFVTDTGKLARVKTIASKLPEPPKPPVPGAQPGGGAPPPDIRPAARLRQSQGKGFGISHPENWETFDNQQSSGVTIAPREGLVRGQGGGVAVGFGVIVDVYVPRSGAVELERDTSDLIRQLSGSNTGMRVARAARGSTIDGRRAMTATLTSPSPFRGQEIDWLVTVDRGRDVLYLVFVAPETEFSRLEATFDEMLQSLRLAN